MSARRGPRTTVALLATLLLTVTAGLGGCVAPTAQTDEPAVAVAAGEVVATLAPATATPAPTAIAGTHLDGAYLARGGESVLAAVREGTVEINNAASSCSPDHFGTPRAGRYWNTTLTLDDLPADPVAMLQFMVALGAFRRTAGVYWPARQDGETIFAALDGLALPRVVLWQTPPATADAAVTPRGLALHAPAELTLIGRLPASAGPPRVLVAVSDPSRSGTLVTRHYFAALPLEGPGLSLAALLALNEARYEASTGVVWLTVAGEAEPVALNTLDEALAASLLQAAGLAFVDTLSGAGAPSPIIDPLVPHPPAELLPTLPANWALTPDPAAANRLLLRDGANGQPLAAVRYDQGQLAWVWEPV